MSGRNFTDFKAQKKDEMTAGDGEANKTSGPKDKSQGGNSFTSPKEFPGCLLTPIKEHIIHLTRDMQWPASREHDYAKTPEKLIPRGAISENITDISKPSKSKASAWKKSENKKLEQALSNCHSELFGMRDMLLCHGRMSVTQHYRELLSLQMSLILEQQQQIQQKEAELVALRQEKQQLESRIERMDRRMSVMQRRSRLANCNDEDDETAEKCSVARVLPDNQPETSTTTNTTSTKLVKSSADTTDSKVSVTTSGRAATKRKLQTEKSTTILEKKKIKLQPSEMRTEFSYEGIEVGVDTKESILDQDDDKILIPSWRTHSPTTTGASHSSKSHNEEDLSDETYLKRHRKFEESERKRKRWDLQRARSLSQHQYLLDRYKRIHEKNSKTSNQKQNKKSLETFKPKMDQIKEIEIDESFPVSAFACTIPYIEPKEFELPWFDLDEREAKEMIRTTRSRSRANKSGSSSSPPPHNNTTAAILT